MADFPPLKNAGFVFYVSLVSQGSRPAFQANPTLASGDVKVSTDGGAFANLGTLPTVTPAAGKQVKVTLSAGEMNGDGIGVLFSDAAGAEWDDLFIFIQTASIRQLADLANNTATLTEGYAADGAAATLPQILYMILQSVGEFSVSGTTITVKKLDGSTTAMTYTLDDATNPTSRTRAT